MKDAQERDLIFYLQAANVLTICLMQPKKAIAAKLRNKEDAEMENAEITVMKYIAMDALVKNHTIALMEAVGSH